MTYIITLNVSLVANNGLIKMEKQMIKLIIKRIDGEYQVQWIENAKLDEAKTYYTDCKEDAQQTLTAIREHKSFPNGEDA